MRARISPVYGRYRVGWYPAGGGLSGYYLRKVFTEPGMVSRLPAG